jgi:integrase
MRRGEILNLTWDGLDLNNAMIRLEAEDTKDDEPRGTPICKDRHEILKISPRSRFPYRVKPYKDIREGLKKACKEAESPMDEMSKMGLHFTI